MKKRLAVVVVLLGVLGCASVAEAKDVSELKLGFIMDQASTQVISAMGNAMVDEANELGAQGDLVFFDMNVNTMVGQIENFTNAGYDAILVEPLNADDGTEALQAAHDAGIKIVTFDTIPNCDYDYSFTGNNTEIGYKIGESAAKWAQENLVDKGIDPVIGLVEFPESEFLTARADGIRKALEELLPDAEIVITGTGTTEGEGMEAGENFLVAYPDINVVCCINDDSAHGVYQAFSAAGYADAQDRGIFSCDGTEQSKEYVGQNGVFKCVVDLELTEVARMMVDCAVEDLTGEDLEYEKDNFFPMNPLTYDTVPEEYKKAE
ncbi:sugar ABC transporter substrate-binding protein [Lachnospiraceae bacterium OF09-6]|nr:sugar ABC transporter substrate-binding protein [Lachnospiraceae bacterium OF09-6]